MRAGRSLRDFADTYVVLGCLYGSRAARPLFLRHRDRRRLWAPEGGQGSPGQGGDSGQAGSSPKGRPEPPGLAGSTGAAGEITLAGLAGDNGGAGTSGLAGNGDAGSSGAAGDTGSAGSGAGGASGLAGEGPGGSTGEGGSGPSLLANGDFSSGETNWHVEGNAPHSINNGSYCVTVGNNQSVLVGWNSTAGMPLAMHGNYQISYQASSSGPLSVSMHLKVGHDSGSFATIFETDDNLSSQIKTFEHAINNANDDSAGLAFTLVGAKNNQTSNVCFDNVALVKL